MGCRLCRRTVDRRKKLLEDSGYVQYEVSNFAKKGLKAATTARTGAWKITKESARVPSAQSGLSLCKHKRYCVLHRVLDGRKNLPLRNFPFRNSAKHMRLRTFKRKDRILEFLMMGFRMREGISSREFYRRFSIPLEDVIGKVFSRWAGRGLPKNAASSTA